MEMHNSLTPSFLETPNLSPAEHVAGAEKVLLSFYPEIYVTTTTN